MTNNRRGWLNYPAEQLRKAPAGVETNDLRDVARQITAQQEKPQGSWLTTPPPYGSAGRPYVSSQLEEPLIFEYPPGINLIAEPRSGFGLTPFTQLRGLADLSTEIRLPIEVLKREIRALEWDIVPANHVKDEGIDDQLTEARKKVSKPDGITLFDTWVNQFIEEILVTDAPVIYLARQRDGKLVALEILDGTTIRPLLDNRGRVPLPPTPAYIQTIRGVPSGEWTREELWYIPFNKTTRHPYGHPPVEDIIINVNIALRRAYSRLAHYTEGNVPEALAGLPASWSVAQIEQYQSYWDALVAGNVNQLRRMKFMPTEGGNIPVYEFNRTDGGDTQLDELLLRYGCWAVGVSPAEFGLVPGSGLGGSGFAEGQADIQYRMGLGPLAQYLKNVFDIALPLWGFPDAQFKWTSLQNRQDALQQAQIDDIYLRTGVYSLEFVQEREGVPPEMRPDEPPQQPGLFQLDASGGASTEFFRKSEQWSEYR